MKPSHITLKVLGIGIIAGACLVASMMVYGLVGQREVRFHDAEADVASTWGEPQEMVGPILVLKSAADANGAVAPTLYVLPKTLTIESVVTPETRNRGIFHTTVFTEALKVHGTFASDVLAQVGTPINATLEVGLSDTRGIEKQITVVWDDTDLPFSPGTNTGAIGNTGLRADVPLAPADGDHSFSFELSLKGSEGVQFAPLGDETVVTVTSPWERPSFIGAYPPSDRTLGTDGFSAAWNVSSFGRSYPHTWYSDVPVSRDTIRASLFGVSLHEGVDLYTQVSRSVTYAVLFILVTFTVFFLFEILTGLRLHPVQYLLIGSALALFYLLLLSLAEHIGFPLAYAIATSMIILLITGYSVSVLQQKIRAFLIFFVLLALYGYLYFVLSLEDYALLFGSLLVFALLASVMYLTRRIDWYALGKSGTDTNHATDMSPKV